MGRGTGVIRPTKNGIQFDFYYRGIRCRETIRTKPTKTALEKAKQKMQCINYEIGFSKFEYAKHFPESTKLKQFSSAKSLKVSTALWDWMETAEHRLAYSTDRDYRSAIEFHLIPEFGELRVGDITTRMIRHWLAKLTISEKRKSNILVPLRNTFKQLYEDEVIDSNPLDRIPNGKPGVTNVSPLSESERISLLEACDPWSRCLFKFAISSGLRTGELIALTHQDIDFKKALIRVNKSMVKRRIKETKTSAGMREVHLHQPAKDAIDSMVVLKQQADINTPQLFVCGSTLKPWQDDQQVRKLGWIPAIKKSGIRYRRPYETRHTFASIALCSGANPMWVASQMGHKDWGMIRRTYGRFIKDDYDNVEAQKIAFHL